MEDPGAGARGQGDHHGAVLQFSGGGGAAVTVTPEPDGGLLPDGDKVLGTVESRLFASEEGEKGFDFPVRLVDPVEAVSASLDERMCEAAEVKDSSAVERLMGMGNEKGGSLPFPPQDSAEPGSLLTCHEANGGLSDNAVRVPSAKAGCSKDVGCIHDTLEKATEGRPRVREDFVGNGNGDWIGVAELKTCMDDLDIQVSGEAYRCDEGLLDSMKHGSEQRQHGIYDLGTFTEANNELEQHDLAHLYSVPSISGSIGVSVDRKAVPFHKSSDNPVTSHLADGGLQNNNCDPSGCMYSTVGMVTEGNPSEQNSSAGKGVLNAGVNIETSPDNMKIYRKEPHDGNKGLPDLVKPGIEQLPAVTCVKKNPNPNSVEKYGLLPKGVAEDTLMVHENSIPSISGSSIGVSLDGKSGHIGDLSEHSARMDNVAFGSQGGHTFSLENRFSRSEVNTSEDRGTGWMEAAHDAGNVSFLGEHHIEELPCGADGLTLLDDAYHELERVLPNIDPVGSCPVDEASVLSIYGSSIDAHLVEKGGQIGYVSERSSNMEKLACHSLGGDMLLCESGPRFEASGNGKNQESSIEAFNTLNFSVCKSSMEELKSRGPCLMNGIQQISQKYGIPESPPERGLNSSYTLQQQQRDDKPCFSGRESSALCLDRQDSGVGGSGSLDLNACNSADDKACSVHFVSNGNDTESQSQQLSSMLVFRRRNPKRAASSRNLRSEKPDQISKASGGSRRPKKVEIAKPLYQSNTSTLPNKITRERSDLNRSHKSSAWGSLEKLMDGFSESYGSTSNSCPTYLEDGRSSKRSDHINLPSTRKCRSSRSSKNRCSTLSDIGHLTDELNERSALSAISGSDASLESRREVISKVASYTSEFTGSANIQHSESDLVSSVHEICAAETHCECAKTSTSGAPLKNDNGTVMLPVGFSPDSVLEVASITCESNSSASHDVLLHENSPDAGALNGGSHHSIVLPTSYLGRNQGPSSMQLEQWAKTAGVSENTKREQTNPSQAMMNNDADKGDVQTLQKSKTVRKNSVVRKQGSKMKDGITRKNLSSRSSTQISSSEAPKSRAFSNDAILPDLSELLVHTGHPELVSCLDVHNSAPQDHDNTQSDSVTDNGKGITVHTVKSPKHKRKDASVGKKGKVPDSHMKGKSKKKNIADDSSLDRGLLNLHSSALSTSHAKEQSDLSPVTEHGVKNSGTTSTDLPGNTVCKIDNASIPALAPPPPPRAAWVCCDDCQKWRCIPAELADVIGETNCRWTCKDNRDRAFADCSIPQEKSNAEINAELDLSDVSADEADADGSNSKACRAPSWTHVRLNLFLHRNRRTQSIDESMVCNCKPPQDGRMGCGDGCLNRMLNIECVKRTCPCGEHCSNQQFQRRNYAKLRWFHSGKKGYGLQLQEDVSEGRFLIEYVGEVLDIASYESRQQYYASKGQKHFYFMALNGGEVIDACTKGNLGRFINHSCSPNCRTEKWMVNGEVCIGIFAMRNIKKGEELTFDYNYVRVSGAAPQKCFCGTAKCRGYIGGDISVVDIINQDDTEAGHFEHIVVQKDSEESMVANGSDSHGSHPDITEPEFSTEGEDLHDFPAANAELEPLKQTGGTLLDTSKPENSLDAWCSQEDEDVVRTPVHVSRTIESSLQHFPVHGIQSSDCLQQTPCTKEVLKAPNVVNGSAHGSVSGGNLGPGANANKRNNLKHHRNVKQLSPIDNGHILGVEGTLNNLLDRDGGISKRKDATNGYLKLLFLTAAGGSSGGTSKSVRDLSLILDALLKTKSHAVLLDIINKNGLQMLHNILKHNRNKFHMIPILRKLLKVLEFLALKEILTSEHINGGPTVAGYESFRDSMMILTRHNDVQVHQIARNFRDRWFPRNIARSEPTEFLRASTSSQDFRGNMVSNSIRRKRKSRWDYQPDEHYKMVGLKLQKAYCEHGSFNAVGLMRNKMQAYQGANEYQNGVHGIVNSTESADDEVPPGFESQQERQPVQASECVVAPGLCMGRYQPSLTISYGVPIALVQHIGTPEAEGQCHQKWIVAPGVPFNPFPPLPPYPRGSPCPSSSSQISQHDGSPNMKHRTMNREGRVHRTWRNGPRTRWPYSYNGRRFPSNHHRSERCQPSRPQ